MLCRSNRGSFTLIFGLRTRLSMWMGFSDDTGELFCCSFCVVRVLTVYSLPCCFDLLRVDIVTADCAIRAPALFAIYIASPVSGFIYPHHQGLYLVAWIIYVPFNSSTQLPWLSKSTAGIFVMLHMPPRAPPTIFPCCAPGLYAIR